MNREEWIEALRKYEGTPFARNGRTEDALDCVGLLLKASSDLGYEREQYKEIATYRNQPIGSQIMHWCHKFLEPIPYNRLQPLSASLLPGDIIIFWIHHASNPCHAAVYTGTDKQKRPTVIHAYAQERRKVMEMPLDLSYWSVRLHSTWSLPYFTKGQ